MSPAMESVRDTIPPAREPTGGANEDVSWLRANRRAFPESFPVAAATYIKHCPLQWRGRAGLKPASVSPFAMGYALSLEGAGFRRTDQINTTDVNAGQATSTQGGADS